MQWTLDGLCIYEPCIWTLYMTFAYTLNEVYVLLNEYKHTTNTTMATKLNIIQVANFDIHDESNLTQRQKKCK